MAASNAVTKRVLVIAGSDSSGGAGMQRDLAVLASCRVRAACAVTAVTAQSDSEVRGIQAVPAAFVAQQIDMAASAGIDAIKVGMLGTADCARAVAERLGRCGDVPIVVDPVLVSTSGRRLLEPDGVAALRESLAPLTTLLTPNLEEASVLLGTEVARDLARHHEQATALACEWNTAVLLKGGHADGDQATDVLASPDGSTRTFSAKKLARTMRGTGCALSTAIAAHLALGDDLETACHRGKQIVYDLIQSELW